MINSGRLRVELERSLGDRVLFGPLTRDLTSFRIGGPALAVARPACLEQLSGLVTLLHEESVPFFVLGAGTNLIFADKGYKGVLIRLKDDFERLIIDHEGLICVGAGARMPRLAIHAINQGYEGLEHLAVIPGTVGGGVVQNAGSGGRELATHLESILVFDSSTSGTHRIDKSGLEMGHRTSILKNQRDLIVLEARFRLSPGDREDMLESVKKRISSRKEKMPLNFPNAGSIFKHPPSGEPPGWLIEQAGCKGLSVGGAMISERHANFIVNTGSASCDDVLKLMEVVRERVFAVFHVALEPEVEIVK